MSMITRLREWHQADQADSIAMSRDQIIWLLEEIDALSRNNTDNKIQMRKTQTAEATIEQLQAMLVSLLTDCGCELAHEACDRALRIAKAEDKQ